MAGDLHARRRKIKEKVKDAGSGDSGDDEYETPSTDGSTCLSAVVVLVFLGGVGLLVTMVSIQSGAVPYGGPPAPQRPLARRAEVVVEQAEDRDDQPPPSAQGDAQPEDAAAETATAAPSDAAGAEGSTLSATTESVTAEEAAQGAPLAADVAHTVAAPSLESAGAPPPPPPPPEEPEFRLEGSEAAPADEQLQQQPVEKQVRVRQMVRIHTHEDGSVTEEVVSEHILQPGDEGYDDLGKDPVTVTSSTGPVMTTTAGG